MRLHYSSESAVCDVARSVDKTRFRRGEKSHYFSDIFGAPATAHRTALDVSRDLFWVGFIPFAGNVSRDITRHYSVDRDALRTQNAGHRQYHRVYSALGRPVVDLRRRADASGNRADTHNAAARLLRHHDACRFLAGEKRSSQIDVVNSIPKPFGNLEQLEHRADTGVIHEDI